MTPEGAPGFIIRPAAREDVPSVAAIESRVFVGGWSPVMFEMELEAGDGYFLVAETGGVIAGYVVYRLNPEEAWLLELAVSPEFRRKGLGRELLRRFISAARESGARQAILEVRTGSAPAISLYENAGFQRMGMRRNYYSATGEDAYVMGLNLVGQAAGVGG
ncbi:MAG: N-alpha-acetyltransferase RimI [Myxococcota bacterium]|nr:N-alpha-acetyltransferase RimI [Myxococcota bacterium]